MLPLLKYQLLCHQIEPRCFSLIRIFLPWVLFILTSSVTRGKKKNWEGNSIISFFFFYLSVVKLHPLSSLKIADFHLSAKKPELIGRGAIWRTLWIFWRTSHAWTRKTDFICGIFRLGLEKCGNPFIIQKDNERCAPAKRSHCRAKPDSKRQLIFKVSPMKRAIILLKNNINM